MITPTSTALLADRGFRADPAALRRVRLTLLVEAAVGRQPAPPPRPRCLASSLDGLLNEGAPVALSTRAAAARAFAAGNGILSGQIIDRAI